MVIVDVLCSGAFVDVLRSISQDIEKSAGIALNIEPGMSSGNTSRAIPWRLQHGEKADIASVFDEFLDELVGQGFVDGRRQAPGCRVEDWLGRTSGGATARYLYFDRVERSTHQCKLDSLLGEQQWCLRI